MDREIDRKLILDIPKDKLADFIFMHLRNYWAVDGLYYIFIEEEYGTEVATEIDRKVWEVMGKVEARKLKEMFGFKDDVSSMIAGPSITLLASSRCLSYTGHTIRWWFVPK